MDDRDHPVARLRHMCVLLFQTLGEKAAAVGPDLMALQRRVMVEMECPLPRDSLGTAIARVCSVTPELVVDAANSLEPAMRREACRIMRRMDGDRAAMEPTLVVRVADPDIEVVAQAMAALLKFGWVTESALTRARRRILDAEDSNWRVEGMLARMEAIVAEEDDSE